MSERLYKGIFFAGIGLLTVLLSISLGLAIGHMKIWPYQHVKEAWQAGVSLVKYGELVPEGRSMTPPEHASRQRWKSHQAESMMAGYYVFMGFDRQQATYMAWMFNADGQQIHQWVIEKTALKDVQDDPLASPAPHALSVLEDGSIIVGSDYGLLTRLDACSRPMWQKRNGFHHSLHRADDGSYWTWRALNLEPTAGHFHYLHQFDPETGEEIREIGLVEDVIKPISDQAQIFGLRADFGFRRKSTPSIARSDIFHPNDLEVLSAALAPAFPMFEAGDLLISLRNIHLVAVLDGETAEVKWFRHGPWLFQHDPDFLPDGSISIYSNNSDRMRSEIIRIDPQTGRFWNPFLAGNARFYSHWMGKHQVLPNGNTLVVVPGEGRILELDPVGNLVLEFNNLTMVGAATNQHVENGHWLPIDYFTATPTCPN